MDFNQKTAKLTLLFMTVNLVAVVISLATTMALGIIVGLVVFSVLVIVLPIVIQYRYLSKKQRQE